jgi:hypothetical protein
VCEAAIVGGAGGVEWSGLVTIASMFYRENGGGPMAEVVGALAGSMLEFVVAHEVAHQYWHGLVGSDSREHPFLDESLAQYSALLYLEDRYGRDRAEHDGELNVKANYQTMRLLGESDAAVDRPVEAFGGTIAYAGLVYGKAPYFYDALRKTMGDQAFFAALRAYADKFAFRVAPSPALAETLAPGDQRVAALAKHWLVETHGDEDLGEPDGMQMIGGLFSADARRQILRELLGPNRDLKSLIRSHGGAVSP